MSKSSGDVPHGTALLDLDLTATPLVPKRPMADSTTALFDVTASPQGTYLSASTDMPNLLCDSILLKTSMGTSLSTSVSAHNDGSWGAVVPGILYVTSYKDLMRAGPTSASMFNGYVSVAQELDGVELPFAAENGSPVKYVALEDNEVTQLRDWLPAIFGFIDQHARSGKAVVIFCQAGKSRSVSFALAFMMREYKISTEQALETLRRGGYYRADPNITFLMQLRALEPLLHGWTVPC